MDMVLDLLAMGVRQPSESAHSHPDLQVHPLGVAGADMLRVRVAHDLVRPSPAALGWAVARRDTLLRRDRIQLFQHRVVNLAAEGAIHGLQVGLMSVRRQLNTVFQSGRHIRHKLAGIRCAPFAYQRGDHQLGIRAQGRPGPDRTKAELTPQGFRQVPVLRKAERPDFITLDTLAGQVAKLFILILGAGRAEVSQQFEDRGLGHSRHAHDTVNPCAFDHRSDDLRSPFGIQLVHGILLRRDNLSCSKAKNISAKLNTALFLPALDLVHIYKRIALKLERGKQALREVITHHAGLNIQFLRSPFHRQRGAVRGDLDFLDLPFTHDYRIHETVSCVKRIKRVIC